MTLYQALARFDLNGGTAHAENLVLKRDRAEIMFDGTFYFDAPLAGKVRGAVFIGNGKLHAVAPDSVTELDSVRRMLHADAVDSTFKTAVLRFSDDTMKALDLNPRPAAGVPDDARKLASEFEPRQLRETGVNVAARVLLSILNEESPGVFVAEFDGGSRGRFGLLLDYQGRLPTGHFQLDAGEKGLFFAYDDATYRPDIWMAFYSLTDYERRVVEYSDAYALVKINRYDMGIDVRDWKHMKLEARLHMTSLADGVRAIPLVINETLTAYDSARLKKALRLRGARLASGGTLNAIQEDWDGSVTLVLPTVATKGQPLDAILGFEGEFLTGETDISETFYVRADCWYPRHENLQRAQFDLTFQHKRDMRVASIGQKVREEQTPDHDMVTEWRMDQPVPLATFAVGDFDVFTDKARMDGGEELELDFYRAKIGVSRVMGGNVKTDFLLAELGNCVRYFSAIFGPYPYPRFGATFHPYDFGQGFPTMLMLPKSDRAEEHTYSFIAHETSHQWWGDLVVWRSYRDQWLSEGFADYSGVLYTSLRDKNRNVPKELLRAMHDDLLAPPRTLVGVGKGRLVDIGPIIMGHRLNTRESFGAYQALIYSKGALVLQMLDFLFSDPSTGDDKAFFDMMKDFVKRYGNNAASTENFMAVANEHFANAPLSRSFHVKDLNWFFKQWVYESYLPSYDFSYWIETLPDGSAVIHGAIKQENAPAQWVMPLPLVIRLGKDKFARGIVFATGAERPATIHTPSVPESVELDPDRWILSEKTTTTKVAHKN